MRRNLQICRPRIGGAKRAKLKPGNCRIQALAAMPLPPPPFQKQLRMTLGLQNSKMEKDRFVDPFKIQWAPKGGHKSIRVLKYWCKI